MNQNSKKSKVIKENFLVISAGDPSGIGAEIIFKSLKNNSFKNPVIIFGNKDFFPLIPKGWEIIDFEPNLEVPILLNKKITLFHCEEEKEFSFDFFEKGVKFVLEHKNSSLITAPINKDKWIKNKIYYKGHTDYLKQFSHNKAIMFFYSENFKLALYTIHTALKEVHKKIKKELIIDFFINLNKQLQETFNQEFSYVVPGFNPHCGEDGLMGDEEKDEIIPALTQLKEMGLVIKGPLAPDTCFSKRKNKDEVYVSWYHDQGLIPFKMLNFNSGVNVTLGLPFLRTSPDHGTAYDIFGQNKADESSMTQAIQLADNLMSQK